MARRRSPYQSQIENEVALRFGPQADALASLLRQAVSDRESGIAVQHSTARGLKGLASRAQPVISDINRGAAESLSSSQSLLNQNLMPLAPNADPIKAASMRDFADARARQAQEIQASQIELKQRQLDAAAGELAGVQAVNAQYAKDKSRIADQLSSLTGQQGAYAAARLGDLLREDRQMRHETNQKREDRKVTRRGQDLSAGLDPKTGKPYPGGKLDPDANGQPGDQRRPKGTTASGVKAVTPQQHQQFSRTVQQIAAQAKKYAGSLSRQQIADKLEKGRPAIKIKKGDPLPGGGTAPADITLPAIKPVPRDITMTAALDIALDGHLSRETQRRLQKTYIVRDLDLTTYGEWKRKGGNPGNQRIANAARNAASSLGRVKA